MAAIPPPEGMTEEDYDAIHAAVVETVRGRWFLAEYARRGRVEEVQDMLAAIGRLESAVASQRALPPPSDSSPHLRLLTQRAEEIATRLSGIIEDLRDSGADAYLCDDLETQARAIAGLRPGASAEPVQAKPAQPMIATPGAEAAELPRPAQAAVSAPAPVLPRAMPLQVRDGEDPRLAALSAIERLSLAERLALFS